MAKTESPLTRYKRAVGQRVQALRKSRRIMQTDFAKILGTSKSRLSNIERGNAQLRASDLQALLQNFPDLDLMQLITGRVTDEQAPTQDQFQAFINKLRGTARSLGPQYAQRLLAATHDHLQLLQLYALLHRQHIKPEAEEAAIIAQPYLDSLSPSAAEK